MRTTLTPDEWAAVMIGGAVLLIAQTISTLAQLGIRLQSIDEPNLDNTAAGKLSANVIGAMNQFFSDSLSEKTKDRMKIAVEKGR